MEFSQKSSLPNPMASASFFSRLTFWWLNPLFGKGYDRRLEPEDMYEVLPEDSAEHLVSDFESEWQKEQATATFSGRKPSLEKAAARFAKRGLILVGLFGFLNEAVRTAQPLLLFYLVSYFTPGSSITKLEAYLYAMGVTLASVMSVILHQLFFFYGLRTGMQLRIATSGCVYRKALRLGQGTYASVTTGHVVNLLSSDAQRFNRFVAYVHFVWITPVQMVVTMYLLWQLLGVSCLVGLAVMLLMILYQARLGRVFAKLRLKTARLADTRCKYLNEILSGMRVVKISTLETSFSKLIHQIRRSEIGKVRKTQFLMAFNKALEYPSQCIVSFITFTTYVMLGNPLTAAVVFSSIAFLNALQRSVAKHFPPAVQMLSETKITLKRIKAFLELDELSFERVKHKSNLKSGNSGVVAKGITASWNQEGNGKPTLQDISFEVKKGDLLMVVGPVGCGKSSLLMTMLGELQISAGNLSIKGKIGYAPQLAWVFSGSVRQNIVFGQPLEEDRYWRVIKACALEQDVELLPEGDLTLVGEKGLTLSGGQKARICLARAVYYEADVYLLDDPLSAVDVRVGRQLFDDCINGLISECPRILVTHQLQYLRNASEIIYLEEGKIGGRGSFTELASAGVDLVSLLSTKETYDDDDNDSAIDDDCEPAVQSSQVQVVLRRGNGARGLKAVNRWSTASSVDIDADLEAMANKEKEKPVIEPEARPRGNIPFSLYFSYFKAGASCVVLCALLVFFTTAQGALTLSDWWLSQWSSSKGEDMIVFRSIKSTFSTGRSSNTTDTSNSVDHHMPYIIMYGLLVAATLILSFMRAFLFFHVTVSSSKVLFNRMFDAVMRAPIYFFDTNPIGRILNRFSGDTSYMDNLLPETFFDFLQLSFMAVAVVIVNVTTMPFILVGLVPIALVFYCLRNYYIKTSREIKRLEATGRSPLLSHVTASLQGLTSIRAHNSQKLMMKEFNVCQDHHTEAWFLFICSSRWLAYRLDFLCLLFVFMASFTPVFMAETRDIDAGIVGLCLTYALLLTGMFQWCVRQSAEVENQMTAVERIIEHCNLEPEGEWSVKSFPPYWPELGLITAEGVSFKHHPTLPRVLKNVNFCIRPKEKVGIVGRTGAGKSSLLSAILRLAEPSSGTIRIDGIDITEIGLHDLRSKLSVIPQDPVLFSGTLRKNLDPFNQFGDSELWVALHEVQLKDAVCCLTGGLDAQLAESGSNFSVGQRQLICLARAILRGNRILIMDEATANVDQITDALIQETLRRKFRNCTVLTIAHRLKTIMDSDRVMVLESGRLKEFEEPHLLLQNKFCYFYRLVEQTGSISAAQLAEVARKAYELRHKPQTHDSVPDVVRTHLSSYIPVSGYTDLQLVSNL